MLKYFTFNVSDKFYLFCMNDNFSNNSDVLNSDLILGELSSHFFKDNYCYSLTEVSEDHFYKLLDDPNCSSFYTYHCDVPGYCRCRFKPGIARICFDDMVKNYLPYVK